MNRGYGMKLLGLVMSTLGAFGFIFYVILWSVEDYYYNIGPIWPIFLWVGATIMGIFIISRTKKRYFP